MDGWAVFGVQFGVPGIKPCSLPMRTYFVVSTVAFQQTTWLVVGWGGTGVVVCVTPLSFPLLLVKHEVQPEKITNELKTMITRATCLIDSL